nr:prenyl transferase [Mycoleptodicus sp. DH-2022a]
MSSFSKLEITDLFFADPGVYVPFIVIFGSFLLLEAAGAVAKFQKSYFSSSSSSSRQSATTVSNDTKPSSSSPAATVQPKPHWRESTGISCPYEYILGIYGRNHFEKFITYLDPKLKRKDPVQYKLALRLMDAIHFGAILVDDIADGSTLRKGKTAAHLIYGSSETINRAYTRIFEVLVSIGKERPALLPLVLSDIREIHEGQDISLVWRRDGLPPSLDKASAVRAYRECASLKTGALFRLLGHMVYGNAEHDALMSQVGWYCHLQNDCKNVFSGDYVQSKGTVAEDLRNGEYSLPIILASYGSPQVSKAVKAALDANSIASEAQRDAVLSKGVEALQTAEVRDVCLDELSKLKGSLTDFSFLWGREEKMTTIAEETK